MLFFIRDASDDIPNYSRASMGSRESKVGSLEGDYKERVDFTYPHGRPRMEAHGRTLVVARVLPYVVAREGKFHTENLFFLVRRKNSIDGRTADGAMTFECRFAILHRHPLSILHFCFLLALDAIIFCHDVSSFQF